jgi:hypothetical protein
VDARRFARSAAIGTGFLTACVIVLVVLAEPAAGELTGPCTATGTFASGPFTVDAATADKVVVPIEDDVSYQAAITATQGEERSHEGHIDLELPPPFRPIRIEDWGTDSTTEVSDADTYEYDLPSYVPRGVELLVTGKHVDTAGTCTGEVRVEIDGGPLDAPALPAVAVAGTFAAGFGVFVAAKPKG